MNQTCSRCFGRGYLAEKRKPSRRNPQALGFYARTCPRCGGTGTCDGPRTVPPIPLAPPAVETEGPAEFLRRLAQNDYMIDGHFLPDGRRLLELADRMPVSDRFGGF